MSEEKAKLPPIDIMFLSMTEEEERELRELLEESSDPPVIEVIQKPGENPDIRVHRP